jgi:signal transduction histidine kinase
MKDEFLATLSHELRTPLGAILLWTKMLRTDVADDEQLAEGLKAIETSAEAQSRLIEDLLDTSRIASGKLRLQMRDVELAPLLRSTIEALQPTADAKNIAIQSDFAEGTNDDDAGVVLADPDRLRQIVWNLLTNAVKFTPTGGRVTVSLARTDDAVEIRVADTGQGIEASFMPHLFERFKQHEASISRRHSGLGLGLNIVKQLAELHGGSVLAHSDGKDKGALFTVRLPALPPPQT